MSAAERGKGVSCQAVGKAPARQKVRGPAYSGAEVETVVRLSIAGESDPAIARAVGRTKVSVRKKLDRIGVPGLLCNGQSHGLRLCVPSGSYDALKAEAARRDMPVERLAARVLTLIADDDMFRAVLD